MHELTFLLRHISIHFYTFLWISVIELLAPSAFVKATASVILPHREATSSDEAIQPRIHKAGTFSQASKVL